MAATRGTLCVVATVLSVHRALGLFTRDGGDTIKFEGKGHPLGDRQDNSKWMLFPQSEPTPPKAPSPSPSLLTETVITLQEMRDTSAG